MVGFRWIELSEEFQTTFTTGNTTPNYGIDVNNHLYGGQLGAVGTLHSTERWLLDAWAKAGLFANVADQGTNEDFRSAGGGTAFVAASNTNTAFAGDIGVTVGRRITDRLMVSVGYMAMWLEGVALAPEQIDNSDPSSGIATVDHSGGVFYQGAFAGVEYLW